MAKNSYEISDWLGYLSYDEIDALKEMALELPKNPVVVNIGAGGGTSTIALLESRPDLTVYSIDLVRDSTPFGCLEGEMIEVKHCIADYEGRYHQICGDSKTVPWNTRVDMVFVDGDHSYEGCKGDIEKWLPWIDGIIAFHDYRKTEKEHPGVDQAIDEMMLKHKVAKHVDTLIAFYV